MAEYFHIVSVPQNDGTLMWRVDVPDGVEPITDLFSDALAAEEAVEAVLEALAEND